MVMELKEKGGSGRRGSPVGSRPRVADDGKRSEAEWTLYGDGIEERVVPEGEVVRLGADRG